MKVLILTAVLLGGLVAVTPKEISKEVPRSETANHAGQKEKSDTNQRPTATGTSLTAAIDYYRANNKTGTPDDESSQKIVMRSAVAQGASAVAITFLTAALLWYSHRGWTVAKDQLGEMRRQLEAYERPWIAPHGGEDDRERRGIAIVSGVLKPSGAIFLIITPVLTNVGKSVAVDVDCKLELVRFPSPPGDVDPLLLERIAALQRERPIGSGFALFPGDPKRNMSRSCDLPADPAREEYVQRYERFACIGTFFYAVANSETKHVTSFACFLDIIADERIRKDMADNLPSRLNTADVAVLPLDSLTRAT